MRTLERLLELPLERQSVAEQRLQREESLTPAEPEVGKADLHIHSAAGDALPTPREILDYVEEHTDFDLIAITDHDDIQGALDARDMAAHGSYRFEVIVGSEVTTLGGHLLALFVEHRIPSFQPLEKTIEAVHEQGGLCVVPHPMSWLTFSVGEVLLRRYGHHRIRERRLDGFEEFNPSVAGWVCHKRAHELNVSCLGLPQLGGSDAHQLHHIGTAYTLFVGRTGADFRRSLIRGETTACGSFWSAGSHLQGAAEQSWKSMIVHPSQKLYRAIGSRLAADHAPTVKE